VKQAIGNTLKHMREGKIHAHGPAPPETGRLACPRGRASHPRDQDQTGNWLNRLEPLTLRDKSCFPAYEDRRGGYRAQVPAENLKKYLKQLPLKCHLIMGYGRIVR
jgi:hypothetical protein